MLKSKTAFYQDWRWSENDINILPFWKYEFYLKLINEDREKKNEEIKKQQKEQQAQQNSFKAPKIPNIPNYSNMLKK